MTRQGSTTLDQVLHHLLGAQQTATIYPPEHPRVSGAVRELFEQLVSFLETETALRIAYTGDGLVLGDESVPIAGDLRTGVVRILQRGQIDRLVFRRGVRRWEVGALVDALAQPANAPSVCSAELLGDARVEHIEAGALGSGGAPTDEADATGENLVDAWQVYSLATRAVESLASTLASSADGAAVEQARRTAGELVDVVERQPSMLAHMRDLKTHDDYSYTHSLNVALLSTRIAGAMGVPRHVLEQVATAALLHDVGKTRTPDEVLNKPGKLTENEWEVMQRHSADGMKMLVASPDVDDLAAIVAYEHQLAYEQDNPDHGRWPLHYVSEIVCVADVYDALRSKRPYRDALPPDVAMQIMEEEADAKFSAEIFEGFRRMMGYYPPGTVVLLDNGCAAIVDRVNPNDAKAPDVMLVRDAAGHDIEPPRKVALAESELEVDKVLGPTETDIDPMDYSLEAA
ncbi:MAG: HD domain-containing protein [Acidobacteria bacterium]|nr:HD domain-containing protein [Acidobacteriota bacterium]